MHFHYHPKPKRGSWYPSGMLAPALSFFPPDHDFEGMSEEKIKAYKERMKKKYQKARNIWLHEEARMPWDWFLYYVHRGDILIHDWPEPHWDWHPSVSQQMLRLLPHVRPVIPKFTGKDPHAGELPPHLWRTIR
jgi:hypothetical protein